MSEKLVENICKYCSILKPRSEFGVQGGKTCKKCISKKKHIHTPYQFLIRSLSRAKTSSRINNYDFNLTQNYLNDLYRRQNGKCALTGIKMTFDTNNDTNISIDRTDSSKGYIKGNIQLTCFFINQMKSDLTLYQLLEACKAILHWHNEKHSIFHISNMMNNPKLEVRGHAYKI